MTEEIRQLEYELELEGLLPDHPPAETGERRNQLTRHDLLSLAAIMRKTATAPCSLGLTREQGVLLVRILNFLDRSFSLIGLLVVTACVGMVLAIFGKGFWAWLKMGGK